MNLEAGRESDGASGDGASLFSLTKIFQLNLPCYHAFAVFLPRLGFASMLLLNRVRKYALVANFRIHFLRRKRCFSGGTDTSGGLETLRQLSGLLTDGGRRKKRDVDFTTPKHSGILPAWSTVFRESIIELGSVAPFSVVNPEDAVQIIGGRPVIGSERIRRHARRKVREPRPPQRYILPHTYATTV